MTMNNSDALEQIQQLMSGERWSPETLEAIAEIMEAAGYPILDVAEEDKLPPQVASYD